MDSRPISDVLATFSEYDSPDDLAAMARLKTAHKFVFDPDCLPKGLFFEAGDYADQLAQFGLLRLPFPEVVFQVGPFEDDDSLVQMQVHHYVILAWGYGTDIHARLYIRGVDALNTGRATFRLSLDATRSQWFGPGPMPAGWITRDIRPPQGRQAAFEMTPEGASPADIDRFAGSMAMCLLYSGLGCLNARGVVSTERKEPKFVNTLRAKKGKPPVFGYRWVTVDPVLLKMPGVRGPGTHAPPRLHWRRAHKRTLADGREVLVKAHLVGDADRGFVDHDYRVGAPRAVEPELAPVD